MSERKRGIVSEWIHARKYGFVSPHDGSPDVLAHSSNVRRHPSEPAILVEGEEVEFTVKQGVDGPYAARILRNPPPLQPQP